MKKEQIIFTFIGILIIFSVMYAIFGTITKETVGQKVNLIPNWDELGCTDIGQDCYCCDETPYLLTTRYDSCNNIRVASSGTSPLDVCGQDKQYTWACVDQSGNSNYVGSSYYECYGYLQGGYFYCDISNLNYCPNGCDSSTNRCKGAVPSGCSNPDADIGEFYCDNNVIYKCDNGNWNFYDSCSTNEICKTSIVSGSANLCEEKPVTCQEGYIDSPQCSGTKIVQNYKYSDCSISSKIKEDCADKGMTCKNGQCISVSPPQIDSDNDGIPDSQDSCPNEAGLSEYNGCPKPSIDSDNDGIPDEIDKCPNEAGLPDFDGCPKPKFPITLILIFTGIIAGFGIGIWYVIKKV